MYTLSAAMPLISMEWEGEVGVIVSPIAGPGMEISSSVPSIGLVSVTTTLNKEIARKGGGFYWYRLLNCEPMQLMSCHFHSWEYYVLSVFVREGWIVQLWRCMDGVAA